ncbi:uncharacterized protein LOC122486734 isoform X2 [Prionailurus bengalensis]|uniref:uncharacterized protein LOC122486734 isoform X1 n=1 Tax=Prionailurus bengalensis TaxID=37029 RepID=UPI001CA9F708|nr:uncharacterized protein LOC122486734 isoform X1 [Prionailurus bengalensis]XP_043442183.1 uncharacterized protein LOC122486734 isoform X2 [Prionailurus bengalensis]
MVSPYCGRLSGAVRCAEPCTRLVSSSPWPREAILFCHDLVSHTRTRRPGVPQLGSDRGPQGIYTPNHCSVQETPATWKRARAHTHTHTPATDEALRATALGEGEPSSVAPAGVTVGWSLVLEQPLRHKLEFQHGAPFVHLGGGGSSWRKPPKKSRCAVVRARSRSTRLELWPRSQVAGCRAGGAVGARRGARWPLNVAGAQDPWAPSAPLSSSSDPRRLRENSPCLLLRQWFCRGSPGRPVLSGDIRSRVTPNLSVPARRPGSWSAWPWPVGDAEWPFLTKSNVHLPCNPALPLLGVCPLVTCTTVTAAGLTVANEGNSLSVRRQVSGYTECVHHARRATSLGHGQQRGGAHTRCPVRDPEHTTPREGTRHERPQSIGFDLCETSRTGSSTDKEMSSSCQRLGRRGVCVCVCVCVCARACAGEG